MWRDFEESEMIACGDCNLPQSIWEAASDRKAMVCRFATIGGCPGYSTNPANIKGANFKEEHYLKLRRMIKLHNDRISKDPSKKKTPFEPIDKRIQAAKKK